MFLEAGFDHVYVHQVGPDQKGFFDFYAREVLPTVEKLPHPRSCRGGSSMNGAGACPSTRATSG
jgi:hypothetical protein